MLEHHGDAGDRLDDTFFADQDFTGIVRQQTVDATQQRGLAAAGRTDDGNDFALADIEVDVTEYFERAVILAEAADANARFGAGGACCVGWAQSGRGLLLICHSAACVEGLTLILAQ
jgi:hypothetical protein